MNDFLLVAAALPLAVAALGLRKVPAQRVLTVRRFGRYRRTLSPGWHWVLPVLDRAGLESCSCECYETSKREFDRLLGPAKGLQHSGLRYREA